jgi:hypothetical protein
VHALDRIIVVNAFMHLAPDDEAKRLALYDIVAQKDGARSWANQLLDSMGVANRPAIVRGFLKSLDAIDPEPIQSIFRELSRTKGCLLSGASGSWRRGRVRPVPLR